jgi:chaperonin GroES
MSLESILPHADIATKMRPYHDRLIVQRDSLPMQSETGLDLSVRRDKANTGTVLSRGNLVDFSATRVMFGRSAGTEVTVNGTTVVLMRAQDCFLDLETLLPFHDKVIVQPDPMAKEIRGIIIPDNVNEQPQSGVVVAIGPKCVETKPSEHVLFGKFAGLEVELNGQTFLVIREGDLVAEI